VSARDSASLNEKMLQPRDRILLPLLSLLTIGLLAGSTELIARRMFVVAKTGPGSCMVFNDPSTGARGIPNCVSRGKYPESQWADYRFNSCGHRAGMECGPKQAGVYRIVLIGSSAAMGDLVQQDESFAALLPNELSQRTAHRVDVYNEGMGFGFSHSTTLRFKDVLAAQPDMILWVLFPMDIERASLVLPTADDLADGDSSSLAAKAWHRMKIAFATKSFSHAIVEVFSRTRTALLLRHFLYQSQSQYVNSYLMGPDDETGFLRVEPSLEWKGHLRQFDSDAADMEGQARAAGVPFEAVFVPNRAQAAMISMGEWPAGYDPYKLDNELRVIITRHGGTYIDILPDFRTIPNPERYYFPVDGHPNSSGHAIISKLLAKALTRDSAPSLTVAAQSRAASE
jgi:hypothetical protein